jgi:flagellar hook-length control protein FliK
MNSSAKSGEGSADGASALLRVPAGAAADQFMFAGTASVAGNDAKGKGQVLFGLINQAENSAALENSPVLAAAFAAETGGEPATFTAGANEQNIPAPFQTISRDASITTPTGDSEADPEAMIGQLPADTDSSAASLSDKAGEAAGIPASAALADAINSAIAIAPEGEEITAAAKSIGPAEAPAAMQNVPPRGDAVALDAQQTNRAARTEGNGQSRPQMAVKNAGEAQPQLQGDANSSGGSGDFDGDGEQGNAAGKKNFMAPAGGNSTHGPGIKTSLGSNLAAALTSANAQSEIPGLASGGLQLQTAALKALQNSRAMQAGLILPFDGGAPVDPMTGNTTSQSAQSISAGIQALQAGTPVSSTAQTTASYAQAPNFVARQVGLQINKAIANGQNKFTIRINPPELGRIDVRLEFLADGGVRAALSAEKPETLNLLQRDAAALERALNDAGVKTDAGSLNFSLQQGEAQANQEDGENAGSLAAAGEETDEDYPLAAEVEITEQVIQQMVADGTVDMRV